MATVKFHDTDEFLAELRLEAAAGRVGRKILRIARRHRENTPYPMVSLSVIAAFATGTRVVTLSVVASFATPDGQVVTLTRSIGTHYPDTAEARQHTHEADQVAGELAAAAKRLGLEVRNGSLEV